MNLLEMAKSLFDSDLIAKVASWLGISPDQAGKAVGAGIPTVLAGMMGNASSPDGANKLADMLKTQVSSLGGTNILGGLGSMLGGGGQSEGFMKSGTDMLGSLFGNKLGGITGALAGVLGLGSGIISKLLSFLGPVVTGMISKALPGGISAASLGGLFASNKDAISKALPAGLGNVMGLGSFDGIKNAANSVTNAAGNVASEGGSLLKFLLPLILLAALGFLAYYFWAGMKPPMATMPTSKVVDTAKSVLDKGKDAVNSAAGGLTDKLKELALPANLTKLGEMLNNPESKFPADVNLDGFGFESSSANLNEASKVTVGSVGKLFNLFPAFKLKVIGQVDKSADEAASKKAAEEKAAAVVKALTAAGISADRLTSEGVVVDKPAVPIKLTISK